MKYINKKKKLDELAPHIDQLEPILDDGLRIAPKMMPHLKLILPHLDRLEKDLKWLMPFAEMDGVEAMFPLLDKIAPQIEKIQPYAEVLLPLLPKFDKIIPHLRDDNIDALLSTLPFITNDIDPLLYWCGNFLPMADRMGILKNKALLHAFIPTIVKILPRVPSSEEANNNNNNPRRLERSDTRPLAGDQDMTWWKHTIFDRKVVLSGVKRVNDVDYYVIEVDGNYAGEFRFSHAYELNVELQSNFPKLMREAPPFPSRIFNKSRRRPNLEKWLNFVMSEAKIVRSKEFLFFIKERRRWNKEMPLLFSPLIKE